MDDLNHSNREQNENILDTIGLMPSSKTNDSSGIIAEVNVHPFADASWTINTKKKIKLTTKSHLLDEVHERQAQESPTINSPANLDTTDPKEAEQVVFDGIASAVTTLGNSVVHLSRALQELRKNSIARNMADD